MPILETEPGVMLCWHEAGAGRPVVFVHGWSMSSAAFEAQAEALASSHRVIRYDLRGHGASRCGAGVGAYAIADHARDLAALLEALALDGVALVAWSMGSQVALEALPRIQRRLRALVLLSSTPRFTAGAGWPHGQPEASVGALAARLELRPERTLQRWFHGLFVQGEVADDERVDIARRVLGEPPRVARDAARGGLATLLDSDQRGRLAEVRVPALLVHGERDPVCLPAASEFAAASIAGARRHVVPGVGHAPHLSRPSLVNELLAGFLAERA